MASRANILMRLSGRLAVGCGLARVTRRFRTDENGTTAVEFGLIAVPFFALMFAIVETAMGFFGGQLLETALTNAARLIRTGQAQATGLTAVTFKNAICDQISFLMNCQSNVYVDVAVTTSFSSVNLAVPLDANGNLKTTGYTYSAGHGGDIVVVRAYYEWPVFVNKLGYNAATLPDGNHLLAAATAFRNEPFPW